VGYLNTAPLSHGLDREARFELRRDTPARLVEALRRGELDLGQFPSIAYAEGDYRIVPGYGVTSRGPVRSVCLFHRRPLEQLARVAVDASSRTSVTLLRLLLRSRLGREPEYVTMAPDPRAMLAGCDAALLIGDTALYLEDPAVERLDLAEAWRRETGLPFVFALWFGRPGALDPAGVRRLQAAAEAGLGALDEIARAYGGPAEVNRRYLRENVQYRLGPEELAGLQEFYRRARAAGLIESVPELRFYAEHP